MTSASNDTGNTARSKGSAAKRNVSRQLAWYRKHSERLNAERRQRYRTDAAYREAVREQARRRYNEDADYRQAARERARKRYHEDEAYRLAEIERAKQRYRRKKAQKRKTA